MTMPADMPRKPNHHVWQLLLGIAVSVACLWYAAREIWNFFEPLSREQAE